MVNLLEAREIAHRYPDGPQALAGVDIALRAGELTAVIGPNGSGKSTLLSVLAGQCSPDSGQVLLGGRAILELPVRERARQVARVPQFLPALPELRVADFVLGGRYAHLPRSRQATPADRAVVRRSLERCDAVEWAERSMQEISGGQRQRVLLARALAQEAGALLVDEPTNSLDPEHQVAVFALLAELAREDRAVCVVTHELHLAGQFAGRILLLDAGRVVAEGSVDEVLRPQVLTPVYGRNLHYGRLPDGAGGTRPFVLPWMPRTSDGD